MPKKHTVVVTTERVYRTVNTIKCTDAELAALRACEGEVNEDVLKFITDHADGKDKNMLTATVTVYRCKVEERGEDGSAMCLVKWDSGEP